MWLSLPSLGLLCGFALLVAPSLLRSCTKTELNLHAFLLVQQGATLLELTEESLPAVPVSVSAWKLLAFSCCTAASATWKRSHRPGASRPWLRPQPAGPTAGQRLRWRRVHVHQRHLLCGQPAARWELHAGQREQRPGTLVWRREALCSQLLHAASSLFILFSRDRPTSCDAASGIQLAPAGPV